MNQEILEKRLEDLKEKGKIKSWQLELSRSSEGTDAE